MTVIERILQLKEERNLTSRELERCAGLSPSTLSQWKKGKGKPSLESLIKIAEFFQVSADYLLCLSDDRQQRPQAPLTEEDKLLLQSYHAASAYDRFRIIQICMNSPNSRQR